MIKEDLGLAENDLVSVIIPVFNAADYLKSCVDSVLGQSYSNLEVLLNDDGSTDSSLEICREYASHDCRVKYYHQDNKGQSVARKAMFDKVHGSFVMFVDSDDVIHKELVEVLLTAIKHHSADCAGCRLQRIRRTDEVSQYNLSLSDDDAHVYKPEVYVKKMLNSSDFGCYPVAKLFRSEFLGSLNFPDRLVYEDLYAVPKFIIGMSKIVDIDLPLYFYVQTPGSTLRRPFGYWRTDMLIAYISLFQFFADNGHTALALIVARLFLFRYYCFLRDIRINGLDTAEYKCRFGPYKTWFWKQYALRKILDSPLMHSIPGKMR